MSLVQRVHSFLVQRHDSQEQPQELSKTAVQLYRCEPCSTTYIKETMESCPECGFAVETTPTARDLGFR
jgi:rubrerythrin